MKFRFRRPSFARLMLGLAPALMLSTLIGCGGADGGVETPVTLYPVKGKVILPDGKPLSEGMVTFVPKGEKGRQASGKVQSDGSFQLTTKTENDGAAEGNYTVRIDTTLTVPGPRKGTKVPVVPMKYQDEDGSGLTATIKPEPNDLPQFKLDNTPPPKPRFDRD